ncbi:MAG: zinc-binding dehydrogenase [Pirellulaceae bacterium]
MMNETCKAAVFTAVHSEIELRDVPIPVLQADQLLIQVTCCTICGSDLHTFCGKRSTPTPSVLGHEIIGIIKQRAASPAFDIAGNELQLGDRVTWSVAAACGNCHRCRSGLPQKCESLFKYGHERFSGAAKLSGGLAQYCVLHSGTAIVRLPAKLPDSVACPANCATATVAAAVRQAGSLHGKRVLVLGAGMLGLTACAMADAAQAASVCLCDPDERRRQRAIAFGATETAGQVARDDFDCVFEMSGHPSAVEAAIRAATVGGKIALVGSVSPSPPVNVDPEQIVRRLLTIFGVHNYTPLDLVTAVNFLCEQHQRYPFADLVERSWSLSEVNAAFDYALQQRPIRVAVVPDGK